LTKKYWKLREGRKKMLSGVWAHAGQVEFAGGDFANPIRGIGGLVGRSASKFEIRLNSLNLRT